MFFPEEKYFTNKCRITLLWNGLICGWSFILIRRIITCPGNKVGGGFIITGKFPGLIR